MLQGLDVEPLT